MFLKERLAGGDELLRGVINVIPSAVVTQAIAAAGADLVMIDREHGPIDRESLHAMIAATAGTGCAPLVRVPSIDEAEVKAALDAGAEGVVYPLVRTAEDAERCVSYVSYPPRGSRGWGPFLAHARHGVALGDYLGEVGPKITCCVLIETVEAVANIDAIVAVAGIDLVVVAPFDLSTALGVHGQFDAPEFTDALAAIERAVTHKGLPLGGVALTAERTQQLAARGYRLLFHGIDVMMLEQQTAAFRAWTDQG
jgi:4-hydroxy-2-oxoheptanedioate aldolase